MVSPHLKKYNNIISKEFVFGYWSSPGAERGYFFFSFEPSVIERLNEDGPRSKKPNVLKWCHWRRAWCPWRSDSVVCFSWHACMYRGHCKIPWHVKEGEDAFSTLSWLLFLLEHVLLLSSGRLVVFTSFCLFPSSWRGERRFMLDLVLLSTQVHSPWCALHQTCLSSWLLYLLQGNWSHKDCYQIHQLAKNIISKSEEET